MNHHRLGLHRGRWHHFSHNSLLRDFGRVVVNGTNVFLLVAALAAPDAAENATSNDGSHDHDDDQERNPNGGEPGFRVPHGGVRNRMALRVAVICKFKLTYFDKTKILTN